MRVTYKDKPMVIWSYQKDSIDLMPEGYDPEWDSCTHLDQDTEIKDILVQLDFSDLIRVSNMVYHGLEFDLYSENTEEQVAIDADLYDQLAVKLGFTTGVAKVNWTDEKRNELKATITKAKLAGKLS